MNCTNNTHNIHAAKGMQREYIRTRDLSIYGIAGYGLDDQEEREFESR
jgi:hypothetical protein